jgi:hypothetical protein
MKAKGFNLLRWNGRVDVAFVGRHLLDPGASTDPAYVTRCVKDQIKGTSVTVVLIGKDTHKSDWVTNEIEWSLEKDPPNGILGIRLDAAASIPTALADCGAEVIEWDASAFADAMERAVAAAGRAEVLRSGAGADGGANCGR